MDLGIGMHIYTVWRYYRVPNKHLSNLFQLNFISFSVGKLVYFHLFKITNRKNSLNSRYLIYRSVLCKNIAEMFYRASNSELSANHAVQAH